MLENLKSEDFWKIARRYFVLNGFDGILTVLGITLVPFQLKLVTPKSLLPPALGRRCTRRIGDFGCLYNRKGGKTQGI